MRLAQQQRQRLGLYLAAEQADRRGDTGGGEGLEGDFRHACIGPIALAAADEMDMLVDQARNQTARRQYLDRDKAV
jgi:hypothetical protein